MPVKIEKASELGFCFGVRRAIKIIEKAAEKQESITTLGPIVHNRLVVARLAEKGVRVVDGLDELQDETVAITSHGISPELRAQLESRQLHIIDTTCPIVRSAQKAARKLAQAGFGVVIFGEANHPEVKGLLGWAGDNAIATLDAEEMIHFTLSRHLGILSQTTQSRTQFAEFVDRVIGIVFPHVHELRIINTLCEETQKRQKAALKLAEMSDLVIVVGGRNSANTQHLAEVCSPLVETHAIEAATELKKRWISGKRYIGITAGASTPDEAIQEVILKLQSLTDND